MVIMILPMLLVIKIQQVSYDDKYVYIYNWRTTKTYELKDVKSINEGNILTFDPFFEIEIVDKDGAKRKFDFMPKVFEQLTFMFTKQYTGQLLDFRTKIAASKKS
jgi:acyl-CoA hydrolase